MPTTCMAAGPSGCGSVNVRGAVPVGRPPNIDRLRRAVERRRSHGRTSSAFSTLVTEPLRRA
jgi:hypothetical protein